MIVRFEERVEKGGKYRLLYRMAVLFLKVCLLLIALYLAYAGIRYSYYSPKAYDQVIFELPDSPLLHSLVFAGVCLLGGGLCSLPKLLGSSRVGGFLCDGERLCRVILFFTCIWLAAVGVFYIREHPYYPEGDQLNTTGGAVYARAGDFSMFERGGYIGLYEQQKGLVFLYEILFTPFGDFRYDIAAEIHLCMGIVTLAAGYSFLKIIAPRPVCRILYCLMMAFCLPYIIYLPYVYGDLPSVCFSMILFWALAAYGKRIRKRYLAVGSAAAALGLLTRMNIWIVLIAVGIGMTLLCLEKVGLRAMLAGGCIILAAWGAVRAVEAMYEYRSGFERGVGIPSILWIAMGLQETDGNPGIYNRYQQGVYEECGFQREAAIRTGREYIAMRMRSFWENPAYAKYFFTKKVKMQWLEPLFGSLQATSHCREGEEPEGWIVSLYYGELHDLAWKFANYYQSVVYLAFLAYAVLSLFTYLEDPTNSAGWIPLIAVVGGFLFSLMWESQCRYSLPYFLYLIPFGAVGTGRIAEAAGSFIVQRLNGRGMTADGSSADEAA